MKDVDIASIVTHRDIGQVVRKLRLSHKMTGKQLGELAGMSQSKLSKIETGGVLLTRTEAEKLLKILQCPTRISQRLFAIIELGSTPFARFQPIALNGVESREQASRYIRTFTVSMPPAILLTAALRETYLRTRQLSETALRQRLAIDLKRQELLWDSRRQFHFLMPETALYTLISDPQLQIAQLDRLAYFTGHKRIKIGIIPYQAGLLSVEHSSFILYDNRSLATVMASTEALSATPEHIAEYMRIFAELDKKACYGTEARDMFRTASVYFGAPL